MQLGLLLAAWAPRPRFADFSFCRKLGAIIVGSSVRVIIGAGFILHTIGFAAIGVVIACVAGVASATCFIVLTGWATAFYLWYVNLAVLILAVPIRGWIKWSIAFLSLLFIRLLIFYSRRVVIKFLS